MEGRRGHPTEAVPSHARVVPHPVQRVEHRVVANEAARASRAEER